MKKSIHPSLYFPSLLFSFSDTALCYSGFCQDGNCGKKTYITGIIPYENVGGGDENYEKETFVIEIRPYKNAGGGQVKSREGESEIRGMGATV